MSKNVIIKIVENENGSHNNLTCYSSIVIPEGWAIVPEAMLPLENFPYGDLTYEELDGKKVLTSWTPGDIPEPPQPTPEELRRRAYETEKIIEYPAGTLLTVDEANQLYLDYLAEGDASTYEALQVLIVAAKQEIRAHYPD